MAVVSLEAQQPPPAKPDFNTDYVRTQPGMLRCAQGLLSLAALICIIEGYCEYNIPRYGFLLFVIIVSMLEAICIISVFVLRFDEQIKIDIPLTLLINDGICFICFFIASTMALLSISSCEHLKVARLFGAILIFSMFLVSVGLNYLNYLVWKARMSEKDMGKTSTITESSPTVLT